MNPRIPAAKTGFDLSDLRHESSRALPEPCVSRVVCFPSRALHDACLPFGACLRRENGCLFWQAASNLRCMAVLIILFTSWLVFRGIGALGVAAFATWQHSACYALAVMFVFTGIAHFNKMKNDLVRMVPPLFPRPLLLVYVTGVLEFAGAAGLMLPRLRSLAGVCLIVLLILLFPANVNAAIKRMTLAGKPLTPLWLRAPMQVVFIGLLWWASRP
jgi:uncharacterized membrane protein